MTCRFDRAPLTRIVCDVCHGSRIDEGKTCTRCEGAGYWWECPTKGCGNAEVAREATLYRRAS